MKGCCVMRKMLLVGVAAAICCGCMCEKMGKGSALAKHVVLIGVDGFGAQYIPWKQMPNLSKLRDEGHYAVARCSYPTSSGTSWMSTLGGTIPELHGYRKWNSRQPDVQAFEVTEKGIPPCVFHEVRKQEPSAYTVSLYDWDGIGFVHATNEVSYVKYFVVGEGEKRDDDIVTEGLEQLKAHDVKLTFIYQELPDGYGHKYGWGTPEYTNACVHLDKNIGRVMKALEELTMRDETVIVLTADHGGLGKKHGMDVLECFEIPFLVSGPAVKDGFRLREPVIGADTAPTILDLLGYTIPETWRGRPALVCK